MDIIAVTRGKAANKQFVCSFPDCQKCFRRPDRLIIHIRTHTGEKPYICNYIGCSRKYARPAHLQRHLKTAHSTPTEEFPRSSCPVEGCCGESSDCHLNKHVAHCHKQKPYTCPEKGCAKSFKKHQQLKVHGYEHTQQKPFCCSHDRCEKSFIYPSALKRHMKYHEGYSCIEPGCEAQFSKWILLVKHRKVDHPKEYKCPLCNHSFHGTYRLRLHQKVHQENREVFQCPRPNCGRSYLDKRNLAAHIKSYHDGQRFICQHVGCESSFVTKQKLQLHALFHDPNRPATRDKVTIMKKQRKRKTRRHKNVAAKLCGIQSSTLTEMCEIEDALLLSGISESDHEVLCHVPQCTKTLPNLVMNCVNKTSQSAMQNSSSSFSSLSDLQPSNLEMQDVRILDSGLDQDILHRDCHGKYLSMKNTSFIFEC